MKRYLTKQYIQFQRKTFVGRIFSFVGKLFFGKMVFLTGVAPDGLEFFKISATGKIDYLYKQLTEEGCINLTESDTFESADATFKQLRKTRRRS
jgi:hypothetical protein